MQKLWLARDTHKIQASGAQQGVGADGAGSIAEVLGHCASLAHLDLRYSHLGDDGAERLAVGLRQCTSLMHLDLDSNQLGVPGVGSIAEVLGHCASLVDLGWQQDAA